MIPPMDSVWFKKRLRALKKTQNQLAVQMGLAPARVTEILKSDRKVGIAEAIEMASFLEVPIGDVLSHLGYDVPGRTSVRLRSWVSAGALALPEVVTDEDDSPVIDIAELDKSGDWFALRVEGDSMDRISPPDSIIIVNRKDKRLVANACYVIADEEGRATYKRYRPSPKRFEPVSTNPAHEPIFPERDPLIVGRVKLTLLRM